MKEFQFMDEGDSGATGMLQKIFLFQSLDYTEANSLLEICHSERRQPGDKIIEENSVGQALYLIKKGTVRVYKGEKDTGAALATLGPGEIFGEMSLVEDALTSANVIAESEVELTIIHRSEFEQLLSQNDSIALKIYKSFCRVLSERLRKSTSLLYQHGISSKSVMLK